MLLKLVQSLSVAIALTAVDAICTDGHAGRCRKDTREVSLSKDNVLRLKDYLCRSDRDSQTEIRIQFQRLSGLAAGALLNGGVAPWNSVLYGSYRILGNDILKEYKNLLAQFGSPVRAKEQGEIVITFGVNNSEQQAADDRQFAGAGKNAEIRSFKLPALPDIPLVDETVEVLSKQTWPASLSMFYTILGPSTLDVRAKSPLDEMTIWRYLTPTDVKEYLGRLKRYNSLVADRDYSTRKSMPKSMQLLEYLTAAGWPDTFLYSSADLKRADPCSELDFRTHDYVFAVDIAVIENVSTKPLTIDQLLGQSGGSNQLRQIRNPSAATETQLQSESVTLPPSGRLIVPLGLVLLADSPLWRPEPGDQQEKKRLSEDRFRMITSSRPGTVFQTEFYSPLRGTPAKDKMIAIRKVRESFRPPSYPATSDFAFGPEWTFTGLALNGERILFNTFTPSFFEITASREIGSCPILYAWGGPEATWLRHGKIIHQASSRTRKQSETVKFEGLVHRIRISEEELERATISGITLKIELTNGRNLILLPRNGALAAGQAIQLYANDEIEIDFVMPEDLKDSDVVHSEVTVTGFYDRYPALLLSRPTGDVVQE